LNNTLNLAPGIFFNYPTYPQLSNISGWIAKRLYPAHPYKELKVGNIRRNCSLGVNR
jgi:hypothetical protein